MGALIETRNQYQAKLAVAVKEREDKIEAQVEAFRAQLERTTDSSEIVALQEILSALNKVVAYEEAQSAPVQTVIQDVQPVQTAQAVHQHVDGRAGMPTISIPERR